MERYQPTLPDIDWQQDQERLRFIRSNRQPKPNMARMATYRYARLQAQIIDHNCAGALLFSPMNVRYATETIYAPITNMHSPTRAVFVPPEGKAILYDSADTTFFSVPDFIAERHPSPLSAYFIAGDTTTDRTQQWANEIVALIKAQDKGNNRIAVDMVEPAFMIALYQAGLDVINAERIVERAAAVKSDDELQCMAVSVAIAEQGLAKIKEHLEPGITEQALWAHLAYANATHGNGWFEYAILNSGERTNPWGQECSDNPIQAKALVTVDTGMIGPNGYGADISRTFYCKPGQPTAEQKRLYQTALENLRYNIDLIQAGMSFREFAEKSWQVPGEFWARRYNSVAHGVGMGNEWPHIPFAADWAENDKREDRFEENMVMAIESCIGREDGRECVKLEDMVIVTTKKCQLLSTFPFEADLLGIG